MVVAPIWFNGGLFQLIALSNVRQRFSHRDQIACRQIAQVFPGTSISAPPFSIIAMMFQNKEGVVFGRFYGARPYSHLKDGALSFGLEILH